MPIGSFTPKQRMEAIAAAEPLVDREGYKPSIRLRANQIKMKRYFNRAQSPTGCAPPKTAMSKC
jgi:hypothetical protein